MLCMAGALSLPHGADASVAPETAARSLVLPTDIAPYGKDSFVVADAALQRVFVVARNGTMTVLAGSGRPNALGTVAGGFADGKGSVARFNAPQGIVADASRNVFVADTGNHCIRKITPGGTVSTLAGDPEHEGFRDGPAAVATFRSPRGIALDLNGDVLVADSLVGIRRISGAGNVQTLPFPVNTAFDITVLRDVNGLPIYVASDISGLLVVSSIGVFARYSLDNVQGKNSRGVAGGIPIGHPYSLAGYGSHRVVYTDRFTDVLRVIDIDSNYVRSLKPSPDDAPKGMSQPLGIHVGQDRTSVAIVDAGTRRVVVLHLDPDRGPFSPAAAQAFPPLPDPAKRRVALVGNSMVWWATDWTTSIEGRAEKILNARPRTRSVEVLPVNSNASTATAQLSYVGEFCEAHMADVVALNLNSAVIHDSYSFVGPVSSPGAVATWAAPLRAAVEQVAATCDRAGVKFVVVISPLVNEVSPNEDAIRRLLENDLTTDPEAHATYLNVLRGLPVVDLWPAFAAAEAADGGDHSALYLLADAHLSAAGRDVFATAFAAAIENLEAGS